MHGKGLSIMIFLCLCPLISYFFPLVISIFVIACSLMCKLSSVSQKLKKYSLVHLHLPSVKLAAMGEMIGKLWLLSYLQHDTLHIHIILSSQLLVLSSPPKVKIYLKLCLPLETGWTHKQCKAMIMKEGSCIQGKRTSIQA